MTDHQKNLSAQTDRFVHARLPEPAACAQMIYSTPELQLPAQLNVVEKLLDEALLRGWGARPLLRSPHVTFSYQEVHERVNRIAHYLVEELKLQPGNRVLLRGGNSIGMALAWLAVVKAGLIAVATMPLLRAKELGEIIEKAQPSAALCDATLLEELQLAQQHVKHENELVLKQIVLFNAAHNPQDLGALCAYHPAQFIACPTAAHDIALLAFTSGTTGKPKAVVHTHGNVWAACQAWPRHVLYQNQTLPSDDIVIGSPPLAFTFGLGGLLIFPMWAGASVYFHNAPYTPALMLATIAHVGATLCYTAPTFYRQMALLILVEDSAENTSDTANNAPSQSIHTQTSIALPKTTRAHFLAVDALKSSLKKCVSAGEALPDATRQLWRKASGIDLIDGMGATELFHIFISSAGDEIKPGAIGKVVPGYQARVVDERGLDVPPGTVGKLAVIGPTGCQYFDDTRQSNYVKNGWNYPGDAFMQDDEGYFFYQARDDDMIISAGYNIGAPEVEDCLLKHTAVAECAVIGQADTERGMIVKAFIVLKAAQNGDAAMIKNLQDFVKANIAPYKYPREIEFVTSLPRTETGKLQRFRLRAPVI